MRNQLFICNSAFRAKSYGTWCYPRSKVWHTLDYLLISICDKKKVLKCGRCTKIEILSDHFAVQMSVSTVTKCVKSVIRPKVIPKCDLKKLMSYLTLRKVMGNLIDEQLKTVKVESLEEATSFLNIVKDVCPAGMPAIVKTRNHSNWVDVGNESVRCLL